MWWFCARHARQLRPRRRARPARAAAAVDPLVAAAMLPPLGRERAAGTHGRGGCRRARQARRRAQRGVRAVARGRIARRLALLNLDDFHLPPELQVFAQVLHLSLVFCQQLLHLALIQRPRVVRIQLLPELLRARLFRHLLLFLLRSCRVFFCRKCARCLCHSCCFGFRPSSSFMRCLRLCLDPSSCGDLCV